MQWYDLNKNWISADKNKQRISKKECNKIIKNSLTLSVKKHLVSDVPIGIFLSSGVDSTLVAGIVSSNTSKKIIAITVSFENFEGSENDESIKAKKIAQKYGMEHHIYRVTQKDFQNDLPEILEAMDQPTIDGVNVWYASKAAAKLKLKVVFSGVGGDELFFGYNHFNSIPIVHNFFQFIRKIPVLFFLINNLLKLFAVLKKDNRWKYISKFSNSIIDLWLLKRTILTPIDIDKKKIQPNKISTNLFYKDIYDSIKGHKFYNLKLQIAQIESIYYMRNQLLRDSDWASMYHGVELRTPFVDTELLENLKDVMNCYSSLNNKHSLKSSFKSILPKDLISGKKMGFQTPIKEWTKNYKRNKNRIQNNDWLNYMEVVSSLYNKT